MASQTEFYQFYVEYVDECPKVTIVDHNRWRDLESIGRMIKGPLSVPDLKSWLEGGPNFTELCLDCAHATWVDLDELTWLSFCQIIKECLPNLVKFEMVFPQYIGDIKCQMLLQHLPSTLLSLHYLYMNWNLPLTIQQIGNFSRLQEICLMCLTGYPTSTESIKILESSIESLTCLENVYLHGLWEDVILETWKSMFDAIRSNSQLRIVYVSDEAWRDLSEHLELRYLQFGPRLNQAKEKYLSGGDISPRNFVDALISVRDRVDCLDHLLSEADPNLYAKQAIGEDRSNPNLWTQRSLRPGVVGLLSRLRFCPSWD